MPASLTSLSKGILAYNASKVGMLQSCLSSLDSSLGTIPGLIQTIDEGNCWRDFKFPEAPEVHWNAADFRQFIEVPRPRGCETPLHVLEQALRGTDAWEAFLRLTRDTPGNTTSERDSQGRYAPNRDNITEWTPDDPGVIPFNPPHAAPPRDYQREAPTGTSVSYTLRRLRKATPDLYEAVRRGEMSPHAAAVQAGFHEAKVTVPRDHPERAARIIARHLSGDQVRALIAALSHAAGFKIETD